MKKIFILFAAMAIVVWSSCKKELLPTVSSNIGAPELTSPAAGSAIVVTPSDSSDVFAVSWSKANYGVAAVVNYFVQVDSAGRNFSKAVIIGTSNSDSLSMTNGALNNLLLNQINLPANQASTIEIRTGAAIYGKDSVYSKPVSMMFTTYKELAPLVLYLPGAYQNWSPGTAPEIPDVTTFTYEGYVYINQASDFKFTSAPDWNHINYGDGGNGTLSTNGQAGDLRVNAAGYYKFNADIQALTYSAVLIQSFGIIGTATAGQWNSSTPMTYNQSTGLWTITANLTAGALKFRANDAWDINYGPADSNALTGTLIQTNDAITIPQDGNYTVTIDMSQTKQKGYLYTIVKN